MYGTREILCQQLRDLYPADEPLQLFVWSCEDIKGLAEGMEYSMTDPEIKMVLERLDALPEEIYLGTGISTGTVMEIISQVKDVPRDITVPVDLLESVLLTAEQTLWKRMWDAESENLPVPDSVTRRLSETAKVRALLKK